MNNSNLFPYLVSGLNDPACRPVGHALALQVSHDTESENGIELGVIDAERLREANLSVEDAHRIALENLIRFADDSPKLSIQVLGQPGEPIHFLLYSDHPRASSCLLLPDLYEHASELLHEAELLACVPQRESLVIFPKRDRAYREMLVGKLRAIEADARHPLTFELFALAPGSFTPFHE